MRILHYSLGLFPHRSGGLNRYCTDLFREQCKEHKVALLYPNGNSILHRSCFISSPRTMDGIVCFQLVNAEPVSLLYGIKNPKDFVAQSISLKSFERFYNEFKPDVLHLHTLMGMPEDALLFFKKKGVRIVYTSHDYFGICPKVNLINQNGDLCEGPSAEKCSKCNAEAPSTLFLRLRNSELAFFIRDIIRKMK